MRRHARLPACGNPGATIGVSRCGHGNGNAGMKRRVLVKVGAVPNGWPLAFVQCILE